MNLYNRCKTLFVISIIYAVLWVMTFVPFIIYAFSMAFTGFVSMFDAYNQIWWSIEKPLAFFTCIVYLLSFISNIIGMIMCRSYVNDMNKHTATQNTESKGKVGSIISLVTFGLAALLVILNIIMLILLIFV